MICKKCGKLQKEDDARFCAFCGYRLSSEDADSQKQKEAINQTIVYSRKNKQEKDVVEKEKKLVKRQETTAKELPKQRIVPKQEIGENLNAKTNQTLFMESKPDFEGENLSKIQGVDFSLWDEDDSNTFYEDLRTDEEKKAEQKVREIRKMREKTTKKKKIFPFVMVVLFVVLVCVMTMFFLKIRNTPQKTIENFNTAISSNNSKELTKKVDFKGVEPNKENSEKLFKLLKGDNWEELNIELEETGKIAKYPFISLNEEKLLFFVSRYNMQIESASIFVTGFEDGVTLHIDEKEPEVNGEEKDSGILYRGLMPGEYSYKIYYEQPDGENETPEVIGEGVVLAVEPSKPAIIEIVVPEPPPPIIVTVKNCISDNSEIYINGELSELKPVNGVLTLTEPELNTEIKIIVPMENYSKEAVVVYNSEEQTDLSFDNYIGEPPVEELDANLPDPLEDPMGFAAAIPAEKINSVLSEFYTSYLNCVNSQNIEGIKYSTERIKNILAERMVLPGNVKNEFVFVSAEISAESLITAVDDGRPAILVNVQFAFDYRERNTQNEYGRGGNKSSVQLIYEDNIWKVNHMVGVSDEQFAENQFGNFEEENEG